MSYFNFDFKYDPPEPEPTWCEHCERREPEGSFFVKDENGKTLQLNLCFQCVKQLTAVEHEEDLTVASEMGMTLPDGGNFKKAG